MPVPKPRERQFIVDYVVSEFPGREVKYNVPLGLPPSRLVANFGLTKSLKLAMGSRLMVDAIIWMDYSLVIVEAKIREWVNGIAKLPIYKALIPETPELAPFWNWPVEMICALPYTNEYIESIANRVGVKIVQFTSAVIDESMAEVEKYQSKEWRQSRAADRETAQRLGLNV